MNQLFKKNIFFSLLVIICFGVITFFLPVKDKTSLWLICIFTYLSIIIQLTMTYVSLIKRKVSIYEWPLIKLLFVFLMIQLGISCIELVVGCFVKIPFWIIIVIEAILVFACAFKYLSKETVKEQIQIIEENEKINTEFLSNLKTKVYSLLNIVDDNEIKKQINKLYEEVRYSDPVSSEKTIEIESKIDQQLIELDESINSGKKEEIKININKCITILKERNIIAKQNKK